jgi:hypothetical protein
MKRLFTESLMKEESIGKRALLLTAKLVGISAIWIALISFAAVGVADRIVVALSGSPIDKSALPAETTKKDEAKTPSAKTPPATVTSKPNG